MKEAFQTEDDELQEGDIVMGPDGKPKLSPAAQARKTARDREKSEAVGFVWDAANECGLPFLRKHESGEKGWTNWPRI
jgi:hypothetical protein